MRKYRFVDPPERIEAEPFFVAQTGECKTDEAKRAWFFAVADEARAKGAVDFRAVSGCDEDPDLILFEAWNVLPISYGTPRFALTAA